MNRVELWGLLLIVASLAAITLHVWHWRRGHISTPHVVSGTLARVGFLFLGIVYATALIDRWRAAPFVGLGIVATGILLNLAAGIVQNIRRHRNVE